MNTNRKKESSSWSKRQEIAMFREVTCECWRAPTIMYNCTRNASVNTYTVGLRNRLQLTRLLSETSYRMICWLFFSCCPILNSKAIGSLLLSALRSCDSTHSCVLIASADEERNYLEQRGRTSQTSADLEACVL